MTIHLYTGLMGSGKTARLLDTWVHPALDAWLADPTFDPPSSRDGRSWTGRRLDWNTLPDLLELLRARPRSYLSICYIIDEAQFLPPASLDALCDLATAPPAHRPPGVRIIIGALSMDFLGRAFPATRRLAAALKPWGAITRLDAPPCEQCDDNLADVNARLDASGRVVTDPAAPLLKLDKDAYALLCWPCAATLS